MQVVQVDERTSSWEDSRPVFRVYLHGANDQNVRATWTDTYDITGADMLQVVDWVQLQGGGTLLWSVALVGQHDNPDPSHRQGLTWLIGMDGCDVPMDKSEQTTLDRMARRLHDKVAIPAADRTPAGVSDACS